MGPQVSGISCNLRTPYRHYLGVFHFSAGETKDQPTSVLVQKVENAGFWLGRDSDGNTGTTNSLCYICLQAMGVCVKRVTRQKTKLFFFF